MSLSAKNRIEWLDLVKKESDGGNLFGHESLIGVVDYRGKSPIIVQEHHYLFPLGGIDYLLEHVQSRRMVELLSRKSTKEAIVRSSRRPVV